MSRISGQILRISNINGCSYVAGHYLFAAHACKILPTCCSKLLATRDLPSSLSTESSDFIAISRDLKVTCPDRDIIIIKAIPYGVYYFTDI